MVPTSGELHTVLLTVKVAGLAVLLDLPVALVVARILVHRHFPGRAFLETMLTLPLVLPPVASGLVILLLLRPAGLLGRGLRALGVQLLFTWQGAALAAALVAFPLMLRAVLAGFEAVDPRFARVARTLGASRFTVYRRVTLPLALPGLLSGSLLAFARALGEFGATVMVAGSIPGRTRTLSLALYQKVLTGDEAAALRLALLSTLLAFGVLALGQAAQRHLKGQGVRT